MPFSSLFSVHYTQSLKKKVTILWNYPIKTHKVSENSSSANFVRFHVHPYPKKVLWAFMILHPSTSTESFSSSPPIYAIKTSRYCLQSNVSFSIGMYANNIQQLPLFSFFFLLFRNLYTISLVGRWNRFTQYPSFYFLLFMLFSFLASFLFISEKKSTYTEESFWLMNNF